jgi:hypothetical protein
MARLERHEIEAIINRDKPGFRVVVHKAGSPGEADPAGADVRAGAAPAAGAAAARPFVTRDAAADADIARGLELAELRRRYLGVDAGDAGVAPDAGAGVGARAGVAAGGVAATPDDDDEFEDEIVVVEPSARPGFDATPGAKTVIISGRDRRIIAEQG